MKTKNAIPVHEFKRALRLTRVNIFGAEKIRYGIEALDALAERMAVELCDTADSRAVFMLDCGMEAHKARALSGANWEREKA